MLVFKIALLLILHTELLIVPIRAVAAASRKKMSPGRSCGVLNEIKTEGDGPCSFRKGEHHLSLCRCHTIEDPLWIPLELEHKLCIGGSSGDPQGILRGSSGDPQAILRRSSGDP